MILCYKDIVNYLNSGQMLNETTRGQIYKVIEGRFSNRKHVASLATQHFFCLISSEAEKNDEEAFSQLMIVQVESRSE